MKISQKIIDYAIWYYLRYYPSPRKLREKLKEKFWPDSEKGQKYWWINDDEIEFIITEKLKNIIQEDEVIQSKIRSYINKWKSKLYIKQKLFERKENRELIEKYLEEYFLNWEQENIKKEYEKILKKLENKFEAYELRSKIIERLLRKGFRYNDILKIIN